MANETALAALHRVPFLSHFSVEELQGLVEAGETRTVPEAHVVFREGDAAEELYVVLSGQVRIFRQDPEGGEFELSRVEPGGVFGELALLDGGVRAGSAVTCAPAELFRLTRPALFDLVSRSREAMARLFQSLTAMVRRISEHSMREELAARTLRMEKQLETHRVLARLVTGVAHELNTPLGVIRSASELVRSLLPTPGGVTDPEFFADTAEALELVERNAIRAARLIQEFKRLSAAQVEGEACEVDLIAVIQDSIGLFEVEHPAGKLEIQLDVPTEACRWRGVSSQLSQVVAGLLSNAHDHGYERPGGLVTIGLHAGSIEGRRIWDLAIQDYGTGISSEHQPQIWDPFFTTARSRGRVGLGLSVIRNVMSVLGGEIQIESRLGEGTRVRLTLTRSDPEPAELRAGSASPVSG